MIFELSDLDNHTQSVALFSIGKFPTVSNIQTSAERQNSVKAVLLLDTKFDLCIDTTWLWLVQQWLACC